MTARKANTRLVLDTTIDNVHAHDVLLGRKGERFLVDSKTRKGLRVKVEWLNLDTLTRGEHTLDQTHLVRVQAEHECDCNGTGRYSWGGSVNGVPVHTGEHFACHGKGYQTRADVIRNQTYWNKYARV